jgi:hypothetical protein
MRKKAQIDIQFNWIFILIVGAIILAFFVSVSMWYKGTQEQKISGDIVTKLDSLFMTAKESPKTARYTSIPEVSLMFTCDVDCSAYGCPSTFSGGGISMSTETQVLFTLASFDATNVITWALEWALPHKIANFLYLTHDGVRYVLVYDDAHSDVAYAVTSLLAENSYLTKESINIDLEEFSLVDKNDAFVRIVAFLDEGNIDEATITASLGEEGWDVVYVDGTEESGLLVYTDGSVSYLGLPLLIGGIFAEDATFYSCNVYKAGIQADLVSRVYYERAVFLEEYYTSGGGEEYCSYYFGNAVQDALVSIGEGVGSENMGEGLLEQVRLLKENNAYAVIKGCPRLY